MKTIGMIGGMSWEFAAIYYRIVNREVQRRLGGVHSAKVLLWSFDLGEIEALQAAGDWKAAGQRMGEAARVLAQGGADFLMICCNTMHILAEAVETASGLPLLHIASPLGVAIAARDFRKVGVLGTRYTMAADFLRHPLVRDHSVEIITPSADDAEETHRQIYEELSRGQFVEFLRYFPAVCDQEIGGARRGRGHSWLHRTFASGEAGGIGRFRCSIRPNFTRLRRSTGPSPEPYRRRRQTVTFPLRQMAGWLLAASQAAGGKSGLHGDTVPDNVRRGRPQGKRHREQTA